MLSSPFRPLQAGTAGLVTILVTQLDPPLLTHAQFCRLRHAAAVMADVPLLSGAAKQIVHDDDMPLNSHSAHGGTALAMTWRRHRVALEFERPVELEFNRHVAQLTNSQTGRAGAELMVLYLAASKGLFLDEKTLACPGVTTMAIIPTGMKPDFPSARKHSLGTRPFREGRRRPD